MRDRGLTASPARRTSLPRQPVAAVLLLSFATISCVTVEKSVSLESQTGKPEVSTRSFKVSGFRETDGAVTVLIEPSLSCTETVTRTTTTARKRFRTGAVIGSVLLLAGLTALAFSYRVPPVEERTPLNPALCEGPYRDHPICKEYWDAKAAVESEEQLVTVFKGVMVGVDLLSLYNILRASKQVAEAVPKVDVAESRSKQCVPQCNVESQLAYIRLRLGGEYWCLDLGRVTPGNRLALPADFFARRAPLLPAAARSEVLSRPAVDLLYSGTIVIPGCGERRDCRMWLSSK